MRGQGRTDEPVAVAPEIEASGNADDTRERILDAAEEVLREVGYGHFSVQKVARRAGVYQGNITYYWPRRRDLVLALALRVLEDYRNVCLRSLDVDARTPVDRAGTVVRIMVEEAVRPERVRVLPELWSMANTDPEIARAVIRSHDEVLDAVLDALGVDGAEDDRSAVRQVLLLVGAAIQGLTAIHGHRSPDDPVLVMAKDAVVGQHASLIEAVIDGSGG